MPIPEPAPEPIPCQQIVLVSQFSDVVDTTMLDAPPIVDGDTDVSMVDAELVKVEVKDKIEDKIKGEPKDEIKDIVMVDAVSLALVHSLAYLVNH